MLGVIVASLNIMRRKLARNEDGVDQLITSAMDGADRAAGLVRRLLAFSRIQPLNPTPLDVNNLVSGMSDILHRTLGERVDLATVLGDDLWPSRSIRTNWKARSSIWRSMRATPCRRAGA